MTAMLDTLLESRPTGRQALRLRQALHARQVLPRRRGPRLALKQRVRYRIDQGPFQPAELCDLGPGGLRLALPRAVPEGSRMQILYHPPEEAVDRWVEGRVRWTRKDPSQFVTGVELEFRSHHDREPFQRLWKELSTPAASPIPPQPQAEAASDWFLALLGDTSC